MIHQQRLAVVRGANDVASAVAARLYAAGFDVLLLGGPWPAVTRRGQSFADAAFDGRADFMGYTCLRIDDFAPWSVRGHRGIAYSGRDWGDAEIAALDADVLVDARMRKRLAAPQQRGLARLVIGLGPGFVAGGNCDLAVETGWGDELGRVVLNGPTAALAGEPKPIGGWGWERYVYAPQAGRFESPLGIGAAVSEGEPVATIDDVLVLSPKSGVIRGLIRSGVGVEVGQKCVEVVPRGYDVRCLAERPARIAEGVCAAAGVSSEEGQGDAPA